LYCKLIRLTKSELHPHLFVYRYTTSAGQVISNTVTKRPTIFFIPHVSRCGLASHHTQILVTCCRSKFVVMELINISHGHVISWLKYSNLSSATTLQNLYILLTVHPNKMIVFVYQLDAQILYLNTFIIFLYMFRALLCSSSGGQIVLVQHLVSSLSLGDCSVHRLREDCSVLS